MHLLEGDLHAAGETAGSEPIQPTSIPYARYTIFVCLANIELAVAKKQFDRALTLIEDLLAEVVPLTRVDVPDVLHWKGIVLVELGRNEEALHALISACSLAKESGSNLNLWPALSTLADLSSALAQHDEADAHRRQARLIVEEIAEGLRELGLRESFLDQPRVRELMRNRRI
jgi:tetratricopeptide (TPR) repeat protein